MASFLIMLGWWFGRREPEVRRRFTDVHGRGRSGLDLSFDFALEVLLQNVFEEENDVFFYDNLHARIVDVLSWKDVQKLFEGFSFINALTPGPLEFFLYFLFLGLFGSPTIYLDIQSRCFLNLWYSLFLNFAFGPHPPEMTTACICIPSLLILFISSQELLAEIVGSQSSFVLVQVKETSQEMLMLLRL